MSCHFEINRTINDLNVIVPSTSYYSERHIVIVITTNVITKRRKLCDDSEYIPEEWQTTFLALQS